MRIKLLLVFMLFFLGIRAQALDIVYPKTEVMHTNSSTSFFTGNSKSPVSINGDNVEMHTSGGFFYPVKLEKGDNKFEIISNKKKYFYNIIREDFTTGEDSPNITYYEEPISVIIIKDNSPLRNFPYDGGMTRIQHLDKGIVLTVIGEYGGFYLVKLARDSYLWIGKSYVKDLKGYNNTLAKIENFSYEETDTRRIYSMKLNKKVPFVFTESIIYKSKDLKEFPKYVDGYDFQLFSVQGYPENTYSIHINKLGESFGFKSYYKDSNELVLEIKKFPTIDKNNPLKGLVFTLDAGHGGSELGAVGCLGNFEKDVNLDIVMKLKNELENKGAIVYLTRNGDYDLSLEQRVKFAKDKNTDVFLSIHNNAIPDSLAFENRSGVGMYYFYNQSRGLANYLQNAILSNLDLKDDKLHQESFAVIRTSEYLSVLAEISYMINPSDNAKLLEADYQEAVAKSIVEGLEKYFNEI